MRRTIIGKSKTLSIPTVQTSNLSFTNVTTNSVDITVTSGNGSNRLIIGKQFPLSPTDRPTNNVGYSPNSSFGVGSMVTPFTYAIYNSSGNSVTVSNLASSTTYYFKSFEHNSSGANIVYMMDDSTNNPNSVTTL